MTALERHRSSCSEQHDATTAPSIDAANCTTESFSTVVRQLVTDSKYLVAGAMSSSADRSARLRVLVETAMHTLAAVFVHCCRLIASSSDAGVDSSPSADAAAAADVAEHVVTAARALKTTVEAARSVLESAGSTGDQADHNKDILLSTASVLAKSLSALVCKVRTVSS